jgi:hypothetical protein
MPGSMWIAGEGGGGGGAGTALGEEVMVAVKEWVGQRGREGQ